MIIMAVDDDEFRDLIEWACCWETGPWVAGGSVRKVWTQQPWKSQDIDFFFANQEQFDSFAIAVEELGVVHRVAVGTNNAVTYRITMRNREEIKIQAIRKRFYANVRELLDDFDLNLSRFASDGVQMGAVRDALDDIDLNIVRTNPLSKSKINPMRVLKYAAYGFDPEPALLTAAAAAIADGDTHGTGY